MLFSMAGSNIQRLKNGLFAKDGRLQLDAEKMETLARQKEDAEGLILYEKN